MGLSLKLPASDRARGSFRRVRALLLALVIEALVVLLFLTLIPEFAPKKKPVPITFGLEQNDGETAEPETKQETKQRARGGSGAKGRALRCPASWFGCPDGEHGSPQIQLMLQR